MIKTFCRYLLMLLGILFAMPSSGQALMYLQEGQLEYSLGTAVQILEDSTSSLTFEEVRSLAYNAHFKKSEKEQPNEGFNTKTFWYRFQLYNVASEEFKWLLNVGFPGLDTIEVYQIHKTGEVEKVVTGDLFPFEERPIKHKDFPIPINIRRGETLTVYVRIAGISTKRWSAQVVEETHFLEKAINESISNILISGILLGLFIYNLFLFIGTRQKGYLYYIAYLFIFWVAQLFVQGYGFQLFLRDFPLFANMLTNFLSIVALFFGSLFSRAFLSMSIVSPKVNKMVKIFEALIFIDAVIQASSYFYAPAYLWGFKMLTYLIMLYIPLFIFMGIVALHKKVGTARFYAIAWMFAIAGAVISLLRSNGVLEHNLMTEYALPIGVIMQASLFSFGLANRINEAERERQKAQEETIAALKDNERIVRDQNVKLEQLVKDRTEELNLNLETLSEQKMEIERKNRNIMSSIIYASRIQKSILPLQKDIVNLFGKNNFFVFYRPKDIVSGDFYWVKQLDDKIIFAVVDCTGHGVPGALMSIVGYDLLNNAINNLKLWQPSQILDSMQGGLDSVLRQYQRGSGDGMAISMCTYDQTNQKLYFAGARQPLLYFKGGEMKLIKGDKQSIGGYKQHLVEPHAFSQYVMPVDEPITLYLYSDGYQDQFGGRKKRKYMARNFRELLQRSNTDEMMQQASILDESLALWMHEGNEKQMDDITILGFKINPSS